MGQHVRLLLISFLFSIPAHAELFKNSYVSFELPPRWKCQIEKTEWYCRSEVTQYEKEAVIVLTAKEIGPGDSLAQYEAYLKTPKTVTDAAGKPSQSKVRQVKAIQINGLPWIDGMHLGSEVPFYYTRYLATVKQRIAILVTFSAHQRFYTKYSNDFFRAIQSLKVIATPSLLSSGSAGGPSGQIGAPAGLPSDMTDADFPAEPQGSSSSRQNMILMAIILLALGAYFFLKKKKKPPQNPFGS